MHSRFLAAVASLVLSCSTNPPIVSISHAPTSNTNKRCSQAFSIWTEPTGTYFTLYRPATMSDKNQKLVLAILDFLNNSIENGTVKADDKEGLEVAGRLRVSPTKALSRLDLLNILSVPQYSASERHLVLILLMLRSAKPSASSPRRCRAYLMSTFEQAQRSRVVVAHHRVHHPLLLHLHHLHRNQKRQYLLQRTRKLQTR